MLWSLFENLLHSNFSCFLFLVFDQTKRSNISLRRRKIGENKYGMVVSDTDSLFEDINIGLKHYYDDRDTVESDIREANSSGQYLKRIFTFADLRKGSKALPIR